MHDDPERRALAQPCHDVAVRTRGAGTPRLAHHAGANDESNVRHEEVRCVAHAHSDAPREQQIHLKKEQSMSR